MVGHSLARERAGQAKPDMLLEGVFLDVNFVPLERLLDQAAAGRAAIAAARP